MANLNNFNCTLSSSDFKKIAEEFGKEATQKIAQVAYDQSQTRCPVKTGNLKASGYIKPISKGYEVGYSAPYALYVDIRPRVQSGVPHFLSGTLQNAAKEGLK